MAAEGGGPGGRAGDGGSGKGGASTWRRAPVGAQRGILHFGTRRRGKERDTPFPLLYRRAPLPPFPLFLGLRCARPFVPHSPFVSTRPLRFPFSTGCDHQLCSPWQKPLVRKLKKLLGCRNCVVLVAGEPIGVSLVVAASLVSFAPYSLFLSYLTRPPFPARPFTSPPPFFLVNWCWTFLLR